jgi:protein arginine kinase activator
MGSETVRSDIKVEKKKTELEKLKEELQECIKKEDYEKAAKIRDKIKEIEKNNLER